MDYYMKCYTRLRALHCEQPDGCRQRGARLMLEAWRQSMGQTVFTSDLHSKCVRKTALTRCPFGVELRPMVALTSFV